MNTKYLNLLSDLLFINEKNKSTKCIFIISKIILKYNLLSYTLGVSINYICTQFRILTATNKLWSIIFG